MSNMIKIHKEEIQFLFTKCNDERKPTSETTRSIS